MSVATENAQVVKKRIVDVHVIKAGSNPDVDTDFNTKAKDKAFNYVADLYGHRNVASIITFSTLAARSSISQMCTIYQLPFSASKKLTSLIPPPIEGVDMSLADIYDPDHPRYSEAAEFREMASSEQWQQVLSSARELEGRYRGSGVHACGVIISNEPLDTVVPTQIREDGRLITQWTYPDCESLGLIKFDFLGLDTVDILQRTAEYIVANGKEPVNILELVHGPMDDAATYEMFAQGNTLGIFQFGSDTVRSYLRTMRPTQFSHLVDTTAVMRPGPMNMESHLHYAARKNGLEKNDLPHPEFAGSPLEDILAPTYGLVVFQEQVMKISVQIANFTPKESDALRKAMGKKKAEIMQSMVEKFMTGGRKNEYSEEALSVLWKTMREFGRYGFNKSHSVAYAMTAYAAGYLKTHYPVEFMSAYIEQNIGEKKKILPAIQEANRMQLKIQTVDINHSGVAVAPDYDGAMGCDILYGLAGISSVSETMAQMIVDEREENGPFTSVHDVVDRCIRRGVNNRKVFENLAKAGAFDCFGVSRRSVVDSIKDMMGDVKVKVNKGTSLFDLYAEETGDQLDTGVDLDKVPEWSFLEKITNESNVIGLFLTAHPLSRAGIGLDAANATQIGNLLKNTGFGTVKTNVVATVTGVKSKPNRQGNTKKIALTFDDGTGMLTGSLLPDVVKGIEKYEAEREIEKRYINGEFSVAPETLSKVCDSDVRAQEPINVGDIYMFSIAYRPTGNGEYMAVIGAAKKVELGYDGSLPVRLRVNAGKSRTPESLEPQVLKFCEALSKKFPGRYPLHYAVFGPSDRMQVMDRSGYYLQLAEQMKHEGEKMAAAKKTKTTKTTKNLFASVEVEEEKSGGTKRTLPEYDWSGEPRSDIGEGGLAWDLSYVDSGFTVDKCSQVEEILTQKFGAERVDFGIFDTIYDD